MFELRKAPDLCGLFNASFSFMKRPGAVKASLGDLQGAAENGTLALTRFISPSTAHTQHAHGYPVMYASMPKHAIFPISFASVPVKQLLLRISYYRLTVAELDR